VRRHRISRHGRRLYDAAARHRSREPVPRSSTGETYQIDRALEAFSHGGLVGQGPGGGTVKLSIPDAHADFVFAVAGEEFGMVVCTLIVGLFAFIVLRSLLRMLSETNLFVLLAVTGLVTSFGLQAVVNMASTLHLMPTKGMTLPFISYGGSSIGGDRARCRHAAGLDAQALPGEPGRMMRPASCSRPAAPAAICSRRKPGAAPAGAAFASIWRPMSAAAASATAAQRDGASHRFRRRRRQGLGRAPAQLRAAVLGFCSRALCCAPRTAVAVGFGGYPPCRRSLAAQRSSPHLAARAERRDAAAPTASCAARQRACAELRRCSFADALPAGARP
jgi:hypothetical protein